jgi:outer membrane lipoprotein-sorting protein
MYRQLNISLLIVLVFTSFAFTQDKVEKLKLEMVSKSLHKGKSITIKADVYYRLAGGQMVTHFTFPHDQITITNANGEFKHYDSKTNQVTLMQGLDLSSKNSLFYNFLSGNINDMGLFAMGYRIKETRKETNIVITTWVPLTPKEKGIKKIELAHENYLPIFMGFYDMQDKPIEKVYYSSYQHIESIQMPLKVTEIEYVGDKDSVITRREYSNLKTNSQVEDTYLNFIIPSNAKLISPPKK